MAILIFKDCRLFIGQYNLSGDINQVQLGYSAGPLDQTVFGNSTKVNIAGLTEIQLSHSGLTQFGNASVDNALNSQITVDNVPITIIPSNAAVGDPAYFFRGVTTQWQWGGSVGDLNKFSSSAGSTGEDLIKGMVLENGNTARNAAGNTASVTVGAATANQYVYAALHVLAFNGTNVTCIVQSAAASNFATPNNRITFTAANATGSQYAMRIAGPVTDTFWRVNYAGTFNSVNFVLSVGIK
jgi:hypothetical protein